MTAYRGLTQLGGQDLLDDRCGDGTAATAARRVEDRRRDRELRVVGRRERREPGVLVLWGSSPGSRSWAGGRRRPQLGGAGLPRDGHVRELGGHAGAERTTSIISSFIVAATSGEVTSTGSGSGRSSGDLTSEVGSRIPLFAIACETEAICSGVARTRPWPIALSPTSTSDSDSGYELSGGASASRAPGAVSVGGELKPNSSAVSTIASAPTSTPSGANTVLHDCAKLCTNVPPQGASWALEISRPIRLLEVSTGKVSDELHLARLERRRGGDDLERRARGLGIRERETGDPEHVAVARVEDRHPAVGAAERADGRRLDVRVDRGLDRLARDRVAAGEDPLSHRPRPTPDGEQLPAGLAGELEVEGQLEAADPGGVFVGYPSA